MTPTEKHQLQAILHEAYANASAAQAGMIEDRNAFDCGFAWVTVPATTPLVRYCKAALGKTHDRRYGSKAYPSGWLFWCPGAFNGQAIGIHKAGAQAFAATLTTHGIPATFDARLD